MGKYKYQIHIHTTPCSFCGKMSAEELCRALVDYGYQGAVITNHFYHGNSGIDRSEKTSWREFVSAYERDYIACRREAKKHNLDIIFGIEEVVLPGLEILCYGITPRVLYDNPHLQSCGIDKWVETMRENGVVLIQAHPFREAGYIPNPGPLPIEYIDGIEVYNRGNSAEFMNQRAKDMAKEYPHLIKTSSGDAHTMDRVPCGGIITTRRIRSSRELAGILRKGKYELILTEE